MRFPTWFRNVSFNLHPLVGWDCLLLFTGIIPIGSIEVMGTSEFTEVVGIKTISLAWIGHPLQVWMVERPCLRYWTVMVTHLTWDKTLVSTIKYPIGVRIISAISYFTSCYFAIQQSNSQLSSKLEAHFDFCNWNLKLLVNIPPFILFINHFIWFDKNML